MKPKPLIKGTAIPAERGKVPAGTSSELNNSHTFSFQNILENVMALDTIPFHALPVITAEPVSIIYCVNVLDIRISHPKSPRFP